MCTEQKSISFSQVEIMNGFWKQKQELNKSVTVYTVLSRLKETGRLDAFRFSWRDKEPHKPHYFWESDVAKWIEGVAYILQKESNSELEKYVDEIVDCIGEHQDKNGYFNIYFSVVEPENRFKIRSYHELYCAGHLIEAAIAYYQATGKDRFLKQMCKYADYIEQVFLRDHSASFVTPGHEEIELALVRLYRCTGCKRYLELANFFLERRGCMDEDTEKYHDLYLRNYNQSHLPVREQTEAEGHAVRACYLYCGMADMAEETNDRSLFETCKKLFFDIVEKKMYITGGIGQSYLGEAFTIAYDLPNRQSYSETCAAVSLAMFAHRMSRMEVNSVYADTVELVLYNGMLTGISLDGKAFFYENPLEIDPRLNDKDTCMTEGNRTHSAITQRVEDFECFCCPPNINRFLGSVGNYIYSRSDNTYFIHQYIDSVMCDGSVKISQTTDYPNSGRVIIHAKGAAAVAVRIPGWCSHFTINKRYTLSGGYAYIDDIADEIEIVFDMKVTLVRANRCVHENGGKVAVRLGPIVYCLEGLDNGDDLRSVYVSPKLSPQIEYDEFFSANVITLDGYRPLPTQLLYCPYEDAHEQVKLRFIPYFGFANRGETEMLVWINVK